ncbi:hypothetical protein EDB86DRAFT_586014 [Lactarius hatsudake]|nr:hypothetical protein EDB86DRAFT_586014 [Lactarius hatsudake]
MRCTTIPSRRRCCLGESFLSYRSGANSDPVVTCRFLPLQPQRIPCHDCPKYFSPMRLGHAAANVRPASARGFFQQEYAEGCAVYFSAPATVAFIGIGGISLAVAVPVLESSIMRIQITPQVQRRTSLPPSLLSSLSRPFQAVRSLVATVSPYRLCHTRCNSLMGSASKAHSCTESTARWRLEDASSYLFSECYLF